MPLRLIYSDGKYLSETDHAKADPEKMFAVIGPFDGHMDKPDLQRALQKLLRAYNRKGTPKCR